MNTSLGYSKRTLTDSDVLLSGGGHKPIADFSLKTESIPYIKGPSTDTTAGTWTGSYSGITAYTEGLTILYVPAVAGASTTTLNINNLGAKTCYISGSNTKLTTHYPVGTPIIFTYYNNGWRRAEYSYDSDTRYYLTLNGTVLGHSGKTNLGTFYAVATSDATAKDQVWMRNADNSAYTWRTLGSRAFDSTAYLPLTGGTISHDDFAPFFIQRNHTTTAAAMGFKHYSSGTTVEVMGYIGMNEKDGALKRWDGARSAEYTILDSYNYSSYALPLSGGTLTGNVIVSSTSTLNIPHRTNNSTRASYYTSSNYIHGGEDNASYLGANILIGTWYGFGIYPTISGLTRTLGQNSFWHNARTGNTYTWGDYYKFDGSKYTKVSYEGHVHSYVALSRGVLLYHRGAIGTSPNFDNLKDVNGDLVNGFFEIRNSAETTGETGTKPFNDSAPALSILHSNTLFQLAGSNANGWWIRGKQAASVTGAGLAWQRLVTTSEDQTFTGIKTFNPTKWVLAGEEHNDITNEYFADGLLYNNANTAVINTHASIRNALKFRWYDTYWLIGNIRGSNTSSLGFGIALRDNTNNRLIDCFRVAQDQAYMAGNKIWHAGNDGAGSGLDADLLDGWHKDDIVATGYITSNKANLSSYWGCVWDITITSSRYDNRDITFLAQSAYDGLWGLLHLSIRPLGADNSGDYLFVIRLYETVGNIPVDRVRLYYNNSTGYCALWMNVYDLYGVFNVSIIKKCLRTATDWGTLGSLKTTNFQQALTFPNSAYVEMEQMPIVNKAANAGNSDALGGVPLANLESRLGVTRSWQRGFATSANQYFGNGNVVTIDPTGAGCLSANDTILSLGDLAIRNTQLLFSYDSDGVWYRRITDGPSYGSWKRLAFLTDNVASATNADTLDGYHEDAFLRKVPTREINTSGTAPCNWVWLCRVGNSAVYSGLNLVIRIVSRYDTLILANIKISTANPAYGTSTITGNIVGKVENASLYYIRTLNSSGYDYFDIYAKVSAWNVFNWDIYKVGTNGALELTYKELFMDTLPDGANAFTGYVHSHNHDDRYILRGDTNLQVTGTASALNALDTSKTFIYATVSSNQTLGVSAAMTVGQVLTVLVYNSGSSSITVTVPTSDSWKSLDGLSLTIGALKFGEISILCYTATVYMVSAKLQ